MKMKSKFWPVLYGILLYIGTMSSYAADTCLEDVWYDHGNKQSLTCTANDVALASVSNICISDGNGGCKAENTCILNQPVTFTADFEMPLTAQERFDVGLYVNSNGGDNALNGQCASKIITNASPTFINLDQAPDICGDIDDAHNPQIIRESITVTCSDSDNDGKLNLPWALSWRTSGQNDVCTAPYDAYPGSPSKCNQGVLNIDVFVEVASLTVTKTANPTEIPEIGDLVTYTVAAKNNAEVAEVELKSIIDDPYGDVTQVQGAITHTSCELVTIPAGQTYSCWFTVLTPFGDVDETIEDTVTFCGDDDFGNTGICDSDNAIVTYKDTVGNPTLTKTPFVVKNIAVDVQYNLTVTNDSEVDTLDVNSLVDDKFGDVTVLSDKIIDTNCVTPYTVSVLSNYTCSFTGRITADGLHVNEVLGNLTDEDGIDFVVGDNATVNVSVTFP